MQPLCYEAPSPKCLHASELDDVLLVEPLQLLLQLLVLVHEGRPDLLEGKETLLVPVQLNLLLLDLGLQVGLVGRHVLDVVADFLINNEYFLLLLPLRRFAPYVLDPLKDALPTELQPHGVKN